MVAFLNGCTTILVGGPVAGDYTQGADKRPSAVVSNDISITARVKSALIKDSQIDAFEINIDTYRSVVTLYGHVKNTLQITRVIRLSKTVNGIKKVISKLVVK